MLLLHGDETLWVSGEDFSEKGKADAAFALVEGSDESVGGKGLVEDEGLGKAAPEPVAATFVFEQHGKDLGVIQGLVASFALRPSDVAAV